jgi:hypothetical protein
VTLAEIARRCQGPSQTRVEFAARIGVEPATLTRLYNGTLPFSLVVYRGLMREFPEVEADLVALMRVPTDAEPAAVS